MIDLLRIDPLGALLVFAVGIVTGTVNTIVGAGSLLTFPTLLFLGYPPLVANVSKRSGSCRARSAGTSATGASSPASGAGTTAGGRGGAGRPDRGAPLLVLPATAFARIVPVLILIACGLVGDPAEAVGLGPRTPGPIGRRSTPVAAGSSSSGST